MLAEDEIHALAFGHDIRRAVVPADSEGAGWLLAAGGAGGLVTVWDVSNMIPRSYCRGSELDIYAIAFSPDGSILASTGYGYTKLWDAATGRLLLDLKSGARGVSLAFSPDGRNLAVGNDTDANGGVVVWQLEFGRGVETLRGLEGQISYVCFSPDGSMLAALAHNWEVAIWDVRSGFLRHVLSVPRGILADNAALCFNRDGSRFAFSAGREAKSWDMETGKELNHWQLNEGFVDALAFAGTDRFVSFRVETQDGQLGPFSNAPPEKHPRVCRIRELLDAAPPSLIKEIHDFNWHVYTAIASPTGQYFVVDGLGGPNGERRMIKVFDPTGKELNPIPTTRPRTTQYGWLAFDPTGKLLAALTENSDRATLLEMPSVKFFGTLDRLPYLGTDGKYWASRLYPERGLSLFGQGKEGPLVVLDADCRIGSVVTFDALGNSIAWGRTDGEVVVCDIPNVRQRLAELDLDW